MFIAKIDEAMSHYDVRSIYSKALANQMDKHVYQNLILNRASAASPQAAGQQLTDADFVTTQPAATTIFSAS